MPVEQDGRVTALRKLKWSFDIHQRRHGQKQRKRYSDKGDNSEIQARFVRDDLHILRGYHFNFLKVEDVGILQPQTHGSRDDLSAS